MGYVNIKITHPLDVTLTVTNNDLMTKTAEVLAALPVLLVEDYERLMNTTRLDEETIVHQHLTQIAWRRVIASGVKVGNFYTEDLHAHLVLLAA